MQTTKNKKGTALVITRMFNAPIATVWQAFTDPKILSEWFAPEGLTTEVNAWELKTGGAYKITMQAPDGTKHVSRGVFEEIEKPSHLSYTWAWEGERGELGEETLVEIELKDQGEKTEMTFTHGGFAASEQKDMHEKGWSSALNKLISVLGK